LFVGFNVLILYLLLERGKYKKERKEKKRERRGCLTV